MQSVPLETQIAAIAAGQYGLVTGEQLAGLAVRRRQITTWVAKGRLERVLPNVFRLAGAPARRELMLSAAVLWAGTNAIVSHRSAAELWGFDGVAGDTKAEITIPMSNIVRAPSGIVVHHTRSSTTDRRTRRGLPVTTPERTLVDLAGALTPSQLEIAFESARRHQLVSVQSVERALRRIGAQGRRGSDELQRLITTLTAEPAAESVLEVATARLLRATDLPKPERQVEVVAAGAKYRLDFAWPTHLVALECDGRKFHGMDSHFERNRARWSAITAATGYRFVWATWKRVTTDPGPLIDEVRASIRRSSAERSAKNVK